MVPNFEKFFYPYLKCMSDGNEHQLRELAEYCATYLSLTDADKEEMTRQGSFTKLYDRTQWTGTYLRKAQLVKSVGRGKYVITQRGKELWAQNISDLNKKTLEQYPEFREFAYGHKAEHVFERLVVKLLVAMGYGGSFEDAASVTRYSHDEGIDGVIKEDKLGLDSIYIQAKRYDGNPVGRKELQSFVGALSGKGATKGVFITTSSFTKEAMAFTSSLKNMKIVLIDGNALCNYMIDYNIGVATRQTFEIKKIDTDFFVEG